MNKLCHLFTSAFLLFFSLSCEQRPVEQNIQWQTMEIFEINGKPDTVNRVDGNGKKQGKWIPSPLNDLRDTVFYAEDTLVKKIGAK